MRGGQSGVLNGKQPPEQDQLIDHIQAVAIDQSLNETSVNPELVVVEGYGHWPFHRLPGAVPPVVSEVGSTCSPVAIEDPSALAAAPKSSSSVHASTTSSSAPTSVAEEVKVPWVNGLSIEQATVTIESAGLTIAISGDSSNPAYGMLSQAPDGASEVAKSSVVTVNVGESAAQQKEREDAAAVAQAAADEAARVEAEPNRSPSSVVAGVAVAAGGQ